MGIAPPSKLQQPPQRPFQSSRSRSTLFQLILLQDWQRVLIRVRLFPKELHQRIDLRLGEDFTISALPLHLVCALNPPQAVVDLFLELSPDLVTTSLQPVNGKAKRPKRLRNHRRRRQLWPSRIWKRSARKGAVLIHSGDNESKACLLPKPEEESIYFSVMGQEDAINFTDDEDEESSKGSSISSQNSWSDTSVILQLSPSGGLTPLPLENSHATDSTSESSKSSSLFRVQWDLEPLREAIAEEGGLLPLHIACLFQASPQVIKTVLDAFPIAALSDVLGMLPIHWVASGWSLPPLAPTPPPACPELVSSDPKPGPLEVLSLLKQVIPETVRVQSGNHSMTPDQYIRECMEDGDYKDSCLSTLLEDSAIDDDMASLGTTSCSILFVDSKSDGSSICLNPLRKSNSGRNINALIVQKDWEAVLELVEDEPISASNWFYGIDQDAALVAPLVWKRLPMHLACAYGAPVGILQVLLHAYPPAIATPDPQSSALPLHLLCRSGHARFPTVNLLLECFPDATKAVDVNGRLPIHVAVIAMAPYQVVEALVERDPHSATIRDANGKTPLAYAVQTYGREHMVSELLSMIHLFEKQAAKKE